MQNWTAMERAKHGCKEKGGKANRRKVVPSREAGRAGRREGRRLTDRRIGRQTDR